MDKFAAWSTISLLCFMLATALVSCDGGHPDMTDGEVLLTLHLSLPGSEKEAGTRAITSVQEDAIDISQLKVLVFKESGSAEIFAYEAPQVQLQAGKYIVTLKQSQAGEKYRLVIIANTSGKMPFIPENTPKSDALKMITFDASGVWKTNSSTDYKPIPMWGESATTQAITPTTSFGNITLLRALARIDVGCVLSGETAAGVSGFTMKSVSVYRTRNKGYTAPVNGGTITGNVVTSVSIPTDAGKNSSLTYTCSDGKSLIRTIYVAETEQGSGKDNNVCLVIGGTYAGSLNYYRVDLTAGGSYIPIRRNCKYMVNIKTVSNAGYTTEEEALTGDKTLVIAGSVSAEAWGDETDAGSGIVQIP